MGNLPLKGSFVEMNAINVLENQPQVQLYKKSKQKGKPLLFTVSGLHHAALYSTDRINFIKAFLYYSAN